MQITDIRIFPVDEPKLKAFVSVIFDRCFIVSDIKIIDGNNGYFLSMPSKKRRDGTFKDIAHPLNSETRNALEDAVIKAYLQVMKEKGEEDTSSEETASIDSDETDSSASETELAGSMEEPSDSPVVEDPGSDDGEEEPSGSV